MVTTDAGIHGLWDRGEDAMVIRNDPAGFADAVVRLLTEESERLRIQANARALFETSYAFDKVAPLTLAVYKEIEQSLVNSPGRNGAT